MKAIISYLLSAVILLSCGFVVASAETGYTQTDLEILDAENKTDDTLSYIEYLAQYASAEYPNDEVKVNIEEYSGHGVETFEENAVLTKADSEYTVSFTVSHSGLYKIGVEYLVSSEGVNAAERELLIDGRLPFKSAAMVSFFRKWKNSDTALYEDSAGNEYRPIQEEVKVWQTTCIKSYEDYVNGDYYYYFSEGEHTLTLRGIREDMAIKTIKLFNSKTLPTYEEIKKQYNLNDISNSKAEPIMIEAEDAVYKSEKILFPYTDRSSCNNSPYSPYVDLLNVIGGTNWKTNGSKITWVFDVKTAGYYQISMRAKQNYNSGTYSVRQLELDGNIPFEEATNLVVKYDMDWQMITLSDSKGEPYYFYFDEGKHTLSLETVFGSLADIMQQAQNVLTDLNGIYREILMITGTNPDTLRDYNIIGLFPECESECKTNADILDSLIDEVVKISGRKGSQTAALERLVMQLNDFAADAEEIPQQMSNFSTNLSALATWLGSISRQPLMLDYIYVSTPNVEIPKCNAPWYKEIWNEVVRFLCSFVTDYDNINSNALAEEEPVTVWVNLGRDQATALQSVITNGFTQKSGIPVNIRLIAPDALLRAVASDTGPDVAMYLDSTTISNYALRGALYDLSQFEDYEQAASRFYGWQNQPFELEGCNYALPEQMHFMMMFYRTDIVDELGIKIPKTWDEFYEALAVLNKNKLQIGIPSSFTTLTNTAMSNVYLSMLYQNGGSVYNDARNLCIIDDKAGVNAFVDFCELYTKHGFDQKIDLVTRFRMGEAPIVLNNFTFANELAVSASEINGMWEMTRLPGTLKEDGTIDYTSVASMTGYVMFKNARNIENTWEFLKWITSTEAQTEYGLEMEAIQGTSGRWATANVQAMSQIPWDMNNLKAIQEQLEHMDSVGEAAGGYYTGRSVNNAIRTVVNKNENAKETLYDYVEEINIEIEHKREELGLD